MKFKDVLLIVCYIGFGVLTRTVWHIAPNVEFVTALAIAGAFFVRKNYSFVIPLGIMVVSDLIIGNSPVFIFTWSAFAVAHLIGKFINSSFVKGILPKLPQLIRTLILSELSGILFTIFFYLWTNFGVVVVSSLYPKTVEGLVMSYGMGLPFMIPQLVGNAIIVPAVFVTTHLALKADMKFLKSLKMLLK